MKEVFPDAEIEVVCKDDYPIIVTVKTAGGDVAWTGRQQELFQKNGHAACPKIIQGLQRIKSAGGK